MVETIKQNSSEGDGEWQPFATYVVEYQCLPLSKDGKPLLVRYRTCTHFLESGENGEWGGIKGKPVIEWMLNRVAKQAQGQLPQSQPHEASSVAEFPVLLNLTEIIISDDLGHKAICPKGGCFTGFVSHHSQLIIKAIIEVEGSFTNKQAGYCRTDFFAIRLADGERITLGSGVPDGDLMKGGKLTVMLGGISMDAGVYAIRAVTLLNHHKPALDYLEASLLIIV